jgi:hypothetical protein
MVPGTYQNGRVLRDGRRALTRHTRETGAELLQSPQATRRLAEPEVSLPGLPDGDIVNRRYLPSEIQYPILEGHG